MWQELVFANESPTELTDKKFSNISNNISDIYLFIHNYYYSLQSNLPSAFSNFPSISNVRLLLKAWVLPATRSSSYHVSAFRTEKRRRGQIQLLGCLRHDSNVTSIICLVPSLDVYFVFLHANGEFIQDSEGSLIYFKTNSVKT